MERTPVWDRLVLVATSAWVLPHTPAGTTNGGPAPNGVRRCGACVHPGEEKGQPTPPHSRPPRHGSVSRQVAAAVDRHETLLRDLLDGRHPGRAYISRAADPNPRYAMQSRTEPLPRREYTGVGESDAVIDSVLGRLERHLTVPADHWMHEEPFVLRHRAILDRARFEAVTGFQPAQPTDLAYFTTLDFRFVRGGERYQRWHLSIVVWSELPFGVEHRPPLSGEPGWALRDADQRVLTGEDRHYRDLFEAIARHAEDWLEDRGYEHSQLNISGRRYMQPDFWIAVPSTRSTPDSYLTDGHLAIAEIARTMLRVDSVLDDALSVSVVNGDYLVIRQIATGVDGDRRPDNHFRFTRHPLYLIIVGDAPWFQPNRSFHVDAMDTPMPGGQAPDRGCKHHDRCIRYEYVARQEFCMRDLVDALTDMETYAAFTLYDVHNDMQVWENHLRVYETTAAGGGRLWDALATHLPIRRLRQLGKVHHAIELMHQTLLQGIADLNDLTTLARECLARVHRGRDALNDRFDDLLVQRPAGQISHGGLRQALSETGIFAQIAGSAANLADHATRVAERYQDVIDAVQDAFDERRVREGDAIQKAGVILALSLAFDSIVSIMSVAEPQREGVQDPWLPGLAYGAGAIIFLTALAFTIWITRLGRLGDRAFRARYDGIRPRDLPALLARTHLIRAWSKRSDIRTDGLWRFMKNSSTEALEGHLRDDQPPQFWRDLDNQLAADLAAVWDQPRATHYPPSMRAPGQEYTPAGRPDIVSEDIAQLYAQVGSWSIDALLFTERARRLYRYPLPKLTLLYRCISRMPTSYLRLEHLSAAASNIVSTAELNRVIRRYARIHGAPLRGPDDIELGQHIDQQLQAIHPPTAAAAITAINAALTGSVPATPGHAPTPDPSPGFTINSKIRQSDYPFKAA